MSVRRWSEGPDWSEVAQVPFVGYAIPRGASVDWSSRSRLSASAIAEATLTEQMTAGYLEHRSSILAGWPGP